MSRLTSQVWTRPGDYDQPEEEEKSFFATLMDDLIEHMPNETLKEKLLDFQDWTDKVKGDFGKLKDGTRYNPPVFAHNLEITKEWHDQREAVLHTDAWKMPYLLLPPPLPKDQPPLTLMVDMVEVQ